MKKLLFVILFCTPFITLSQSNKHIYDTLYREGDIYSLLNNIQKDSMLMLERMASFHFHQLINEYRLSKEKSIIYWDDKLWLAARNHNVYLLKNNNNLSHYETGSNNYYTGDQPENRVDYVSYYSHEFKMAGFENCAVDGEMIPNSYDFNAYGEFQLNNSVDQAKSVAKDMFEMWKNSTGHNQNMLDSEHLAHGTSFIFGEYARYGTSVFMQNQKYFSPDSISLSFYPKIAKKFEIRIVGNEIKTIPFPNKNDYIDFKIFRSITEIMKRNSIIPDKKLYELLKTERTSDDESLKRRYLKITRFIGFFKLIKNNITRLEESFLFTKDEYENLLGIEKFNNFLESQNKYLLNSKSWAGIIKNQKEGEKLKVTIVFYLFTKK